MNRTNQQYKKLRQTFYSVLHQKPCIACGSFNYIEADHIKPWSWKTMSLTRRSHKGVAAFYAVPLCKTCHEKKTANNEEIWYNDNVLGGVKTAYAVAMSILLEALELE